MTNRDIIVISWPMMMTARGVDHSYYDSSVTMTMTIHFFAVVLSDDAINYKSTNTIYNRTRGLLRVYYYLVVVVCRVCKYRHRPLRMIIIFSNAGDLFFFSIGALKNK